MPHLFLIIYIAIVILDWFLIRLVNKRIGSIPSFIEIILMLVPLINIFALIILLIDVFNVTPEEFKRILFLLPKEEK